MNTCQSLLRDVTQLDRHVRSFLYSSIAILTDLIDDTGLLFTSCFFGGLRQRDDLSSFCPVAVVMKIIESVGSIHSVVL